MSTLDIKTVASNQTLGTLNTCAETVIAKNTRKAQRGQKAKLKHDLSGDDSSHVFDLDEVGTSSTSVDGSSSYRSYSQDNSVQRRTIGSTSTSNDRGSLGGSYDSPDQKTVTGKDGLSSLFNFIFCVDNDSSVLEERQSPSSAQLSRRVLGSSSRDVGQGRSSSPTKKTKGATTEDALLLEQALKASKKQTAQRTRNSRNAMSPINKLESLDIVMELQLQEVSTPKTKKGKKIKAPSKRNVMNDDNDSTDAAMDTSSIASDFSVFDFVKKVNWINGPALGTFQNISTKENTMHEEVINTYMNYRADKRSIDMIISRIACSIPLYHQSKGMQSLDSEASLAAMSQNTEAEAAKVSSKIKHVW